MKDIVLATINAKWIHPSLALRLLKANLGELEERCEIVEFALRQPLHEKIDALSAVSPKILGISVSIWNHTATKELLRSLYPEPRTLNPVIVMGGPEVSYLPEDAEIFQYADFVIRGEGEIAFRELCEKILVGELPNEKFIEAEDVDVSKIKTAYHLYTNEDVQRKLIYVESSRGCPFGCEFCLSAVKKNVHTAFLRSQAIAKNAQRHREFDLENFFIEIDTLIDRGVKTFKFLDRTFNSNIKRAIEICEFFIKRMSDITFTVHFEMVPTLIVPELIETLSQFLPNTLRLEIGIQTLNAEVAERINLPGRYGKTPDQILEPLRLLREKTNAIIHADLIAGLPGETLESFAKGFDSLFSVFSVCSLRSCEAYAKTSVVNNFEIQLGILKQLPGAPISRHNNEFKMRYNPEPPYEVMETSSMSVDDIARIKNFARFWESLVNRGLIKPKVNPEESIFTKFMILSDSLYAHFGRNWGIDKEELLAQIDIYSKLR